MLLPEDAAERVLSAEEAGLTPEEEAELVESLGDEGVPMTEALDQLLGELAALARVREAR